MGIILDGGFKTDYKRFGFDKDTAYYTAHLICADTNKGLFEYVLSFVIVGESADEYYVHLLEMMRGNLPAVFFNLINEEEKSNIPKVLISILLLRGIENNNPCVLDFVKKKRNIESEVISKLYDTKVDAEKSKELCKTIGLPSYNVEKDPNISWDDHYYNVCLQVSRNSKCLSRKIGALLVRDKRIISTGYSGAPSGIPPCDKRWVIDSAFRERFSAFAKGDVGGKCPRKVIGFKSGESIELCPSAHAEENTILNCARLGIESKGSIMYASCGVPCGKCMVKIINAGIEEVVVTKLTYYDETSKYLLENSDVRVRIYDFVDKPELK